ncbi:MAG: Sir2 silent information regulator family NAD-dependent deacetylase [Bacteroides sp.]|nr:Sir2 silent information regulator family NAD-dependent deacetylase [Eubacterium sp.]MCM1418126.1 Sir2 silent information regulator family NAD-dependent deacetylase [Roseburia sp.]MCM1462249.1 Sir2 silent information regulator family NAD-dependent deacetylase [Bacteroides sp.]
MYFNKRITSSIGDRSAELTRLKDKLKKADAVLVGAGAGLSTAAGLTYSGERFRENFGDFADRYGFGDMYSGGFYPFETPEEYWAYWSRYIYINRYADADNGLYRRLHALLKDKDYFVLTTNVDHQFQKAGFDKKRLFYTQGDYGLFQCSTPCHTATYDNEETIRQMFFGQEARRVPSQLLPRCPKCGRPMTMNLRADDTFVQDEGWYEASERYADFLRRHRGIKLLLLELGVGYNTPTIIKFPFWRMTAENPNAFYACINFGEAYCPDELKPRVLCLNADIAEAVERMSRSERDE